MSILARFNDIIKANINALLDKAEDPGKMIDQYLRDMTESLAEVKRETAGVMAEETRTQRQLEETAKEIAKYADLAKKALQVNNEADARVFIAKKQQLEAVGESMRQTYAAAHENAQKMRLMHDKLVSDIATLTSRRDLIKGKVAVAKTQQKVNEYTSAADRAAGAMGAFDRMERKADQMLDQANALSKLNNTPVDEAKSLEEKYAADKNSVAVEDELTQLKRDLGL
ncbi:MAG: PspA/IM30 family protein [Peptococcaceae bacterium]|jgi:phage shock protein A|nr:PspA/IM30 family protein [Peptococcaceae bacterium]